MKAQVTDAELIADLKLVQDHGGNVCKASRASGRNRSHLQLRVQEAKSRGLTTDTKTLSAEDKLRLELARANADLRAATKEADSAERIRQEVFNLAARSPAPPAWITSAKGALGHRGVPCTNWSDWHFGEVVRPEEVGGVNEFNTDIAIARAKRLVDTTIDLAYNHMGRAKTKYPGAIVCLGGDMMTGDIHEEVTITNDRTPQQQINDLTDTLAASIERMASAFGKVFVPCVVGNHGRDSKKPRTKNRVYTSHEWVIYTNLERYFKRQKHIHICVPAETDIYFKVYNHRYLLTHGDSLGVKGGDGIIGAIGPIMRGTLKTARSESQIGRDFDTLIMGHWHQMLWLPGAIVNSSLKGYDEFARLVLRAPYSRPSQALWFTHPEHGITARWEVFLEGQRQAQDGTDWVSFEQRRVA